MLLAHAKAEKSCVDVVSARISQHVLSDTLAMVDSVAGETKGNDIIFSLSVIMNFFF